MNSLIATRLRCPVCRATCEVSEDGKSLYCGGQRRHCFDFSRSGYLNLAGPHGGEGDLKASVRARSLFLESGYYERLADTVCEVLASCSVNTVLDAGCGEGYYTNRMALGRAALGVDLSSAGIDHAAKAAKREGLNACYAVASLFKLPVADASFDAITNLFAPCAEAEFVRVLRPGGVLIVVAAGEHHLLGLKKAIYDTPYTNRGRADLPQELALEREIRLTYEITVEGRERIDALFSMTPYYWRTSEADRQKLAQLDRLTTEVDFNVYVYRKGLIE